mmetsp:Transcript_6956/g.15851  ORF Transcript_6956/g.15851 Transcript_6956/m.15851 type:complete len:289 (+) Transcript_6956:150-1016(+)
MTVASRAQTSTMKMEVRINGLAGQLCSLVLLGGDTVATLKAQLSLQEKISPSEQQLLSGEKLLEDGQRLDQTLELLEAPEPPDKIAVAEVTLVRRSQEIGRWIDRVKADWASFLKAPAEARDCSDVVIEAVKKSGALLRYASADVKKNREVALAAVSQNGLALEFVDPSLRDDYEVVLRAVAVNGMALEFASDRAKDDRIVIQTAVQKTGDALQFASLRLRSDFSFMLPFVSRDGLQVKYVSDSLRADPELVVIGILKNRKAYQYCHPSIKYNSLILRAMGIDPDDAA